MSHMANKLVILDRDGTLNVDRDDYVKSADEFEPLPGALEAIAQLNHAGFFVAVATNQSGLGRGLFDMAALNAMHSKMNKLLAAVGGRIDAVFFCPHSPEESCACRKPLPGLYEQIGERLGLPLHDVPVVGDSLRDLQAAVVVGAQPHLVLTGKGASLRGQPLPANYPAQTMVHQDLAAFVAHILHLAPDGGPEGDLSKVGP